jgi:2-oxo-4-hydroxy-4-carboxy-5-ureidoimidazoline decarboxylase
MATPPFALSALNAMDQETFVVALGSLFEGPPWIVTRTWHARPFASREDLHQALCEVMYAASVEQQVALIQAHPDLVGRAARAGTLSSSSTREQGAAGLDRLTSDEIATFAELNQAYGDRFGFPFVICARENKKESILEGFSARLHNSRDQEIATAVGEIAKICWLRLQDTVR